jgi:hypothetical protein
MGEPQSTGRAIALSGVSMRRLRPVISSCRPPMAHGNRRNLRLQPKTGFLRFLPVRGSS